MALNDQTKSWILEFILSQPLPPSALNRILLALPFPSSLSPRLRRLIFIRRLSSVPLSDSSLLSLELLHRETSASLLPFLRSAYCAAAVASTLKFRDDLPSFLDAVDRIWRKRIGDLEETGEGEGLLSVELLRWRYKMEMSTRNEEAMEDVVRRWDEAAGVQAVKDFLSAAVEEMGPSFLETAARAQLEGMAMVGSGGGIDDEGKLVTDSWGTHVARSEEQLEAVKEDGRISDEVGADGGEFIVHSNFTSSEEKLDPIKENGRISNDVGADGAELVMDFRRMNAAISKEILEISTEDGRNSDKVGANGGDLVADSMGMNVLRSKALDNATTREIEIMKKSLRPRDVIAEVGEDLGADSRETNAARLKTFDQVSSEEVNRVKQRLRLSVEALQNVVKDPLPDAIIAADRIIASKSKGVNAVGEQNENHRKDVERNQSRRDVAGASHSADKGSGVALTKNTGGTKLDGTANVVGPSFMDWNPSARTYEWEEETIESPSNNSSSLGKGIRLPSPRRVIGSPLKPPEFKKASRKRRKWTPEEEDAFREAVKKYGKGNWKVILNENHQIFGGRTEVDLKDKWRNMTK